MLTESADGRWVARYVRDADAQSPPLPAEAYVGAFRNDYFGDVEVVDRRESFNFG